VGLLDFLLKKKESLIGLDIGATGIKLIELDLSASKPKIINLAFSPFSADVFSGNSIEKTESVAEQVTQLLESHAISDKRVVTSVPGPSVFTKRIKMPKVPPNELKSNIFFEAGNFIPHNIDAVKLDFHVIGESGKNQLDVLVVAVKNEIIDSFTDCLALAGLETAVVDVDGFALQNAFEFSHPELLDQTVALVNVGARYTTINICKGGESLFTGDISMGGKLFTDAIAEVLSIPANEAEEIKKKLGGAKTQASSVQSILDDSVQDIVERNIEYMSSEFNRQLSFFWNASGADEGIAAIALTGGGSRIPGLLEELKEKSGIECMRLEPFRNLDRSEEIDEKLIEDLAPCMSICMGLGLRQAGDKVLPDVF